MRKLSFVVAVCALVYATAYFDCGSNYPPPSSGGGFYVETQHDSTFAPFVSVGGKWLQDYGGATGSVFSFPSTATDTVGSLYVAGGRTQALWSFTEYSGPCALQSVQAQTPPQEPVILNCVSTAVILGGAFGISPDPLYASSPPATVTITGRGFTTTYGMPRVVYYYNDGTFVGAKTATSATSTSISAAPPSSLNTDPSGVYVGIIQNATSGGGWQEVGSVALYLI